MQQGEGGFVKDYRSKLGWEWWTDIHTAHLWEYICLRVNYEPSRFRGMEIGRGEMLESIGTMAARTGLTTQNVRTALEHLKRTGEITCKVTRYGLLIKAIKYAFFQGDDAQGNTQTNTEVTSQLTRKSQGTNTEVTTYKEIKKERRKRNKEERGASAPTLPEIREFVMEEGLTIDPDRFFNFYEGQELEDVRRESDRRLESKGTSMADYRKAAQDGRTA